MMQRQGYKFETAPSAAEQAAAQHLMAKHLGAFAKACQARD